ncbi:MAG: DsbC family protein [Azoarcus sp.]|jgi:thiol:disulfide interchange protein DsbC|nr:DsbC family protein [Azoarcus sp.]
MKKKDFFVATLLALFIVATLWFSGREPASPEERLSSVLSRADGVIELGSLPLEQAIKQVRGNGSPVLVSFEDPICPYCAKLDKKLSRLENLTLYTFLVPILSENSLASARRIWCAPNSAEAWNDWMLKHKLSATAAQCDTAAIDKNLALWNAMGFAGVPRLFRAK